MPDGYAEYFNNNSRGLFSGAPGAAGRSSGFLGSGISNGQVGSGLALAGAGAGAAGQGTLGTTLQFAGMGASVGGPWGAAIGAAVGLGVGLGQRNAGKKARRARVDQRRRMLQLQREGINSGIDAITRGAQATKAEGTQSLIDRGLYNTTVKDQVHGGIDAQASRGIAELYNAYGQQASAVEGQYLIGPPDLSQGQRGFAELLRTTLADARTRESDEQRFERINKILNSPTDGSGMRTQTPADALSYSDLMRQLDDEDQSSGNQYRSNPAPNVAPVGRRRQRGGFDMASAYNDDLY
jgi:hypothetical protein